MIQRIVKLTIDPEEMDLFISMFKVSKPKILEFGGCSQVKLLRSKEPGNIVFTYSYWQDEAALNHYRNSELFKGIWKNVKPLFVDKPEAWSVDEVA